MENEKLPGEKFAAQQTEPQNVAAININTSAKVQEVKAFFRHDRLKIVKIIFTKPIKGTLAIFNKGEAVAYGQALILTVTATLVYTIIPRLMSGRQTRQYLGLGVFFGHPGITAILHFKVL